MYQLGRGRLASLAANASLGGALTLLTLAAVQAQDKAGAGGGRPAERDRQPAAGAKGVLVNDRRAFAGYTLLAPMDSTRTYLIDMQGRVVRWWQSDCLPGQIAYLLENGHLLRTGHVNDSPFGFAPGRGGRVQEYTWEGVLVWDYTHATAEQFRHHDVCKMPNGNVLLIAWEKKKAEDAAAVGCKPATPFFIDCILEVRPEGRTRGKVVWEWHAWDHLIQDRDRSKPTYGDVAAHPERIDINFDGKEGMINSLLKKRDELKKLQSLGYVGFPTTGKPKQLIPDVTHINSVAYHAQLDQIMLSVHEYCEIWIIDHSTTKAEAAGHSGGRYGKGGDLLYRWGNPRAYRAGSGKDQQLFWQHDAHWIPRGLPGAGHALVFNNGHDRHGDNFSSVDELVLPVDANGRYAHRPGAAYGPDKAVWSYTAPKRSDFFSKLMAGAQRLPNGDTLICATTTATLMEVSPAREIVWKYVTPPFKGKGRGGQHRLSLDFTPQQTDQMEKLYREVSAKLDAVLTEQQKGRLKKLQERFRDTPLPGQILVPLSHSTLRLAPQQREHLAGVKKDVARRLGKILRVESEEQLQMILKGTLRASGQAAGRWDAANRGAQATGRAFRAYRYAPDYSGLVGRNLKPGPTVDEVEGNAAKAAEHR